MVEFKPANEVVPYERPRVTLAEAASGRYPCLTWGPNKASFWIMTEGEPTDFWFAVLSRFPYPYPADFDPDNNPKRIVPQHLIDLEIENVGIGYYLDAESTPTDPEAIAAWLLKEGLAPFQAFRVVMDIEYIKVGSYDYEDWDIESDFEIVEREYLEPEIVAQRWEEYVRAFGVEGVSRTPVGPSQAQVAV